jgi:cell division protein ZapA
MAQVSLQINGYGYTLGCGDGEEQHLLTLAADLDRRIQDIKAQVGPSGEARLLLMAALMLADELHDMRLEQGGGAPPSEKSEPRIGRRLRGIAKRAETIAATAEDVNRAAQTAPATEPVAAPPEQH